MYYFENCLHFCSFESRYILEFFSQESPMDVSEFADVGGGGIFSVNLQCKNFLNWIFQKGVRTLLPPPPLPPIFVHVASTVDTVIFTINQGSYIIHKEF